MPPPHQNNNNEENNNNIDDDDEYFLPLEDQRVFGAGIRRKRVPFVRSSEHHLSTTDSTTHISSEPATPASTGQSIANKYLSIVLSKSNPATPTPESEPSSHPQKDDADDDDICPVCNLPYTTPTHHTSDTTTDNGEGEERSRRRRHIHEATLPHQLSLPHSHPPSHLDRTRPGLRYLAAYGWDPDSRVGLGPQGREGIREPVKGKLKEDTVGLGAVVPEVKDKSGRVQKKQKAKVLNAKEVRRGQLEERKKGERLRELFFRDEDVLRYLGGK
ncbi:hypothetical protein CBS63078_4890 [Aspergillus niger]|uniref:G-patch domain-containing protein n=1 Tax=Aspergillus niger (strain ATCC 1015 / CBS 113.46 / FGSC A1144 / LSHB Ac4 / NCTC 3858a / NRRL 328 / USDA 3528.7) TaxID=380704 RepID=G3XN06_ASPNA|nr:hypothetical protein ASPNIDRAFT_49353 [Aspergillus niger ATCC 1015]KAI2907299.1 hypothetical protein CBS63078_4890 [Aspergillus niger]KAI2962838.1 hypothetical protein CBS147323_7078 [Aspergillus niger]KAI2976068.1 hypothetical protein CBS147324_2790 [Aspergillus niger]KAI3009505.1 hypothetical protein CBS147345_6741 [Aspergillus niger]